MFFILVSIFSLVFWPKWPVGLVTSESSGLVRYPCGGFSGLYGLWGSRSLGFIVLEWSPVE